MISIERCSLEISIHALLAESDTKHPKSISYKLISIHALLAESDSIQMELNRTPSNFYPRSPCGERHANLRRHCSDNDFYPRSPCGERLFFGSQNRELILFLSALLAESDSSMSIAGNFQNTFLSTLSLRRATWPGLLARPFFIISIHALLAESDFGRAFWPGLSL